MGLVGRRPWRDLAIAFDADLAAFPCSEDFLDPAANRMDRLILFVELAQRFGFVPAPYAGRDDPGNAALCQGCIMEMMAALGAGGGNPEMQ